MDQSEPSPRPTSRIDRSSAIRDALLAHLRDARRQSGERLPTERQLCAEHGVGRAAVRRALAEIKHMGLITQTVGSGTYVTRPPDAGADVAAPAAVPSPAMLMEARLVLEPALVPLVVRHATEADFAALEACCRAADAAETVEAFERTDDEFHRLLARATHNDLLIETLGRVSDARRSTEWGDLKRRVATADRRRAYGRQHRTLLAALRDRNAAQARDALLEHLAEVARTMFE